jgi:hypothetical protein
MDNKAKNRSFQRRMPDVPRSQKAAGCPKRAKRNVNANPKDLMPPLISGKRPPPLPFTKFPLNPAEARVGRRKTRFPRE